MQKQFKTKIRAVILGPTANAKMSRNKNCLSVEKKHTCLHLKAAVSQMLFY